MAYAIIIFTIILAAVTARLIWQAANRVANSENLFLKNWYFEEMAKFGFSDQEIEENYLPIEDYVKSSDGSLKTELAKSIERTKFTYRILEKTLN